MIAVNNHIIIGTGAPPYMQQASPRHRYTSFEYGPIITPGSDYRSDYSSAKYDFQALGGFVPTRLELPWDEGARIQMCRLQWQACEGAKAARNSRKRPLTNSEPLPGKSPIGTPPWESRPPRLSGRPPSEPRPARRTCKNFLASGIPQRLAGFHRGLRRGDFREDSSNDLGAVWGILGAAWDPPNPPLKRSAPSEPPAAAGPSRAPQRAPKGEARRDSLEVRFGTTLSRRGTRGPRWTS